MFCYLQVALVEVHPRSSLSGQHSGRRGQRPAGADSGQPAAIAWCLVVCMALTLEPQAEPWAACAAQRLACALESQTEPVVHPVQGRW
jgi:hypothetical protein